MNADYNSNIERNSKDDKAKIDICYKNQKLK